RCPTDLGGRRATHTIRQPDLSAQGARRIGSGTHAALRLAIFPPAPYRVPRSRRRGASRKGAAREPTRRPSAPGLGRGTTTGGAAGSPPAPLPDSCPPVE